MVNMIDVFCREGLCDDPQLGERPGTMRRDLLKHIQSSLTSFCPDSGPDIQLACRSLTSTMTNCVLINGDAAHLLRHYFAEPPRKDAAWQQFRYELMEKKHALLKSVSYSSRLAQKFWQAQSEAITKYGPVGGFAVPIRDYSFCPIRMDHDMSVFEGFARTFT